jgi:quercetin dioxygenase-like cupin family protein
VEVRRADGEADVAVFEVTLGPGGSTGWHHHPGVGLASVASGALTVYNEECDKTVYEAGEGFVESREEPMLVHNQGNVDAVFYITFIVSSGTSTEGLRIDDPQPENCDPLAAASGSSSLAATGGPSLAAQFALAVALVLVAGGSGVVALTLVRRSA